ncbi:MAG TPA: hypothetical protein VEO54_05650 [Thermoanaerobaculia bacterium]|nr:hypothetical protein [Thermoanaerobaculia bacterium]
MQPASASPPPRRRSAARSFFFTVLLMAVAFAAGFVPQWLEARRLRETLTTTSMDLRLATLHRDLGLASHEAQRHNFASAAEIAGRFFNDCATLASKEPFSDEPRTKVALTGYASQRDEIMALLAASDPAALERLASLYLTMNGVLARRNA